MRQERRKRRQERRRQARRRQDRGHWQSFIEREGRLTYSIREPRQVTQPFPRVLTRKEKVA